MLSLAPFVGTLFLLAIIIINSFSPFFPSALFYMPFIYITTCFQVVFRRRLPTSPTCKCSISPAIFSLVESPGTFQGISAISTSLMTPSPTIFRLALESFNCFNICGWTQTNCMAPSPLRYPSVHRCYI